LIEHPDAGEDSTCPSRAKRLYARARIAGALVAPVIALAALFFIARSSGGADAGLQQDARSAGTPVATVTATPVATTPTVRFTNHWLS